MCRYKQYKYKLQYFWQRWAQEEGSSLYVILCYVHKQQQTNTSDFTFNRAHDYFWIPCNSSHRLTQAQSSWMKSISKTIFKLLWRFSLNMTQVWHVAQLLRTFKILFWRNSMMYLSVWDRSLYCWHRNLFQDLNFPAISSATALRCLPVKYSPQQKVANT